MKFEFKKEKNGTLNLKNGVLIEGLPGIANVGKIAIDYIIENLNPTLIYSITSDFFPSAVFINSENLLETPKIEIYHKKINGQDFLFLSGNTQPVNEASYEFCREILSLVSTLGCKTIITTGGIGLLAPPDKPKVYCAGKDLNCIENFKKDLKISQNVFGTVGSISGVAGLLIGLSDPKKINGIVLLVETLAHPLYVGMEGANELLKTIEKKYNLGINLKGYSKEMKALSNSIQKLDLAQHIDSETKDCVNYIG
jgi:hypothetical protein